MYPKTESGFNVAQHLQKWRWGAFILLALCASLAGLAPRAAWADTRDSDVVVGKTASERGLQAGDLPDISAENALVASSDGTFYFERDADAAKKIASITKIMTALLTLEHVSDLSATVTVDKDAATVGESSADLLEGDSLSVRECLRALLIPSGNDAATVLAKYVGGIIDPASADPLATFIAAMNSRAKELGCQDTVFTNAHGLDFDAWVGDLHSTARDVYKITAEAWKHDEFRATVSDTNSTLTVTQADGQQRSYQMHTYNDLLGKDGECGVKSGTTYEAGYCFVGAYERDGEQIFTIVLGSSSDEQRFSDTATLANWYYSHMVTTSVVNSAAKANDGQPLVARVGHLDWTDKTVEAVAKDSSQQITAFSLEGAVETSFKIDEPEGDVTKGEKLGTMTLTQDGETLATVELVAAEDEAAPDPLNWVLVQLDRLVRMIQQQETTAKTEIVAKAPELKAAA